MKRERTAITLMELITVLAIIALLAGILIPTLSAVKNYAREAKQMAQFSTIELGLTAFKNDYGDYPPSNYNSGTLYCGAQKLSEALLGLDLLGFHPKSAWTSDGTIYDPDDLSARKGPYLELATTNAFLLDGIFSPSAFSAYPTDLGRYTHVLCDVFGATKVSLGDGTTKKAGAPILYYRSNPSGRTVQPPATYDQRVYNIEDNIVIISLKELTDRKGSPLRSGFDPPLPPYGPFANRDEFFYGPQTGPPVPGKVGYIQDPKITVKVWPYRSDSYILISAGADGLYGTGDDIRNFGY